MTYPRVFGFCVVVLLMMSRAATASALRDGKRFDPAATMTERAEGAPEQLDRVAWMVGHWSVELTRHVGGDSTYSAPARSDITFMNRGHNLMERFHCADFDGQGDEQNTLSFLVYNEPLETWGLGIADSWRENIAVYNGDFEGDDLVLRNAQRRKGGLALTHFRFTLHKESADAFSVVVEASNDGATYARVASRAYTRLSDDDGLFTAAAGYGEAAPGLPPESRQFDFLIGESDLRNDMTFPNGQKAQWLALGTAVYMMNGHCVMEYSQYDVDPNRPDAATTIVRLWNRQMRRWESMYTTNRFNGILHFGGVMEGDRIVLHQFDADAADVPISQWIFHSWGPGGYGWYGNTSRDRGQTWSKTWIIDGTRKK